MRTIHRNSVLAFPKTVDYGSAIEGPDGPVFMRTHRVTPSGVPGVPAWPIWRVLAVVAIALLGAVVIVF